MCLCRVYVEDLCSAIGLVLQKGRVGDTYNVGANSERKNIEVVRRILHSRVAKRTRCGICIYVCDSG